MANRTFSDVKLNVRFNIATSDTDPSYVIVEGGNNHASNIDGSSTEGHPNGQDLALALGKIQNWYANWDSVVWTGDASTVNGHTVATDVPSGAVFTDTHVNVKLATTTKAYLLGTSTAPTSSNQAVESVGDTGVFLTTTAGRLQAGSYAITSGSYAHILKAGSTNLTANAEHVFPNTAGTILNTGTTSYTQTSASDANGAYTIGTMKINGSDTTVYGKDTTYTFANGTSGLGTFKVTPVGGSAQTVTVYGLGTMAGENKANYVPMKPDGTTDLYDSNKIINSKYLPSYVDDVIEGYYKPYDDTFTQTTNATFTVTSSQPSDWSTKYTNYFTRSGTSPNYVYSHVTGSSAPTWSASTYYALTGTTETGESGKIYVDLGEDPADPYRWSGSTYVSMRSPEINAVANVVAAGTNGHLTISYTNGSTSSDVTAYTHPTTAGNKHIPSGGSTGQYLKYSSSGTAQWSSIAGSDVGLFTAATSGAAGTQGTVPAPAQSTYNANGNRHFLRSDATWSDDPITTADVLTLNVIAAS